GREPDRARTLPRAHRRGLEALRRQPRLPPRALPLHAERGGPARARDAARGRDRVPEPRVLGPERAPDPVLGATSPRARAGRAACARDPVLAAGALARAGLVAGRDGHVPR